MMGADGKPELGKTLNSAGISTRPGTFHIECSTTKPFGLILDGLVAVAYLGKRGQTSNARKNAQVSALYLAGQKDPKVAAMLLAGKVGDLMAKYWLMDTQPKGSKGPVLTWVEFGQVLQGANHCGASSRQCDRGQCDRRQCDR